MKGEREAAVAQFRSSFKFRDVGMFVSNCYSHPDKERA